MILYLDTSALVKLYVREVASGEVHDRLDAADAAATSRLAYPEARAAPARRRREGAFSAVALRRRVRDLDRDSGAFVTVHFDSPLARRAGELAEKHALRGFEAIHLASALELWQLMGDAPSFLAYDARLTAAARLEGLAG